LSGETCAVSAQARLGSGRRGAAARPGPGNTVSHRRANARHIAVDDGAEFLARLGLELARGIALVGDELPREHAFAAEGIFMAARHGQQIDQRIKVPDFWIGVAVNISM
jgi:hypothetical protein